jgi:hypothetical protein
MGKQRITGGEPLCDLGLKRIVAVIGAIAEEVDALRPAEFLEEGFRGVCISSRGETSESRLVNVERRTATSEYMRALGADVGRFHRNGFGQLVLHS